MATQLQWKKNNIFERKGDKILLRETKGKQQQKETHSSEWNDLYICSTNAMAKC